jgi:hypothetical protein
MSKHQPPVFDHPNNFLWRLQIMNFLIMNCSPPSCYLFPFRSIYSPQNPFIIHP